MDDENRGVNGMKVMMRSNKFYSRWREWFRIRELRGSVIVRCFLAPL